MGNRFRWLMAFKSLLTGCAGLGTPVPTVCPASSANSGGNGGRWTTKAGGLILETTNILFSYSKTLTPNIHPLCRVWAAAGRLHCAPVPSLCAWSVPSSYHQQMRKMREILSFHLLDHIQKSPSFALYNCN